MNIFTEIKLLVKLNEIAKQEQKLMRLKMSTSTLIQILAGFVQALNLVTPVTQGKVKVILSVVIGCVQVGINTISHLSNPDGTDAKTAYVPPSGN